MKKLGARQQKFVDEYLKDPNATQAYLKAYPGCSHSTADTNGTQLLGNARVAAVLDQAIEARSKRTDVTVDKVLYDLEATRKTALEAGQYSAAVRCSELQGRHLRMFEKNPKDNKDVFNIIIGEKEAML